eukprot:TRINITY_DN916_c1_g3_i1.p1 TRINITY_DN916_c1_g3~~TRINITY_DN916_c1_g3_i1.p1  ORF type:complete len:223 (+),score=86.01 TRINITY_DN916_c1_g3_i1:195-863(+)
MKFPANKEILAPLSDIQESISKRNAVTSLLNLSASKSNEYQSINIKINENISNILPLHSFSNLSSLPFYLSKKLIKKNENQNNGYNNNNNNNLKSNKTINEINANNDKNFLTIPTYSNSKPVQFIIESSTSTITPTIKMNNIDSDLKFKNIQNLTTFNNPPNSPICPTYFNDNNENNDFTSDFTSDFNDLVCSKYKYTQSDFILFKKDTFASKITQALGTIN